MKKFKVSIIAMLAILMGIAGSAFTTRHAELMTNSSWYVLADNANPEVSTNYTLFSGEPDCSANPETVCAIQVSESGSNPSQGALDAIIASSNHFTEADVDVKYKP